jgi:hypothetical protein
MKTTHNLPFNCAAGIMKQAVISGLLVLSHNLLLGGLLPFLGANTPKDSGQE